jgi:type IV pilus assembly protein PilM
MQLAALSSAVHRASEMLERAFPTPRTLLPLSVGVDISDASIRWLGLTSFKDGSHHVVTSGSHALPAGIVSGGIVRDVAALSQVLRELKPGLHGITDAHAALPEEAAYVFSMYVPERTPRDQILSLIEFEFEGRVPISPSAAVYDFDIIPGQHTEGMEIGVSVFPRELAESYAQAFRDAGLTLLSLEIEARSIARAISHSTDKVILLVDFGLARTGFAVVEHGVPIFTSTVEIGGDALTKAAIDMLSLSPEDAEKFKNDKGLLATEASEKPVVDAFTATATALADEIARQFHYWDTRRNDRGERLTSVERVVLVGGSSNLNGLEDFIAGKVQAPVRRGNIWHNIASFDDYIPPIDMRTSLQYATSAGLALRGV